VSEFGRSAPARYTLRMDRRPIPRASLVGALCLALASPGPAAAQGGFFGGLFGGGGFFQQQQQQPNYPGGYDNGAGAGQRHRPRRKPQADYQRPAPRSTGTAQALPDKPAPQKKNATIFVDVFGDTMGQFLANGLDDALADRQDVAVVHRGKGPSGLVNLGFYDWPKTIDTLLAGKDKIDIAVMMIGSNDKQPITENGKTYEVGSDDWRRIYADRVAAIDAAFKKKHIPLIWVGVPITKSSDFADAMAVLNDISRDAAAKTGATYVDTWEAFANDNGEFAAYGPDINGQTVRLRSADGILFTKEGARKLAHFVEAPIRHLLDGKAPVAALPTGNAPDVGAKAPGGKKDADGKDVKETAKVAPAPKPEVGPIVNLNQAPSADKGELAAPTAYRGSDAEALARSEAAPAGRADDARWPTSGPKAP
jgi:uncharacterized protein